MSKADAFFVKDGALFVPTGLGASPWQPQAHGGVSLGGLVAHVLEQVPCPSPMQVVRITLDILGAIPLEPLATTIRIVREGRRVQLVEIDFTVAGKVWLRASALRMRMQETPAHGVPMPHPYPDATSRVEGHTDWLEIVPVIGGFMQTGPGAVWLRFPVQVVDGSELSPLETALMASDLGSGVSTMFAFADWTYANLDITMYLSRLPQSEWLMVDATSDAAGNGIVIANSRLGDQHGMFGSAHQSIFLAPRAG